MAGLRAVAAATRNVVGEVEAYVAAEAAVLFAVARESIHGL